MIDNYERTMEDPQVLDEVDVHFIGGGVASYRSLAMLRKLCEERSLDWTQLRLRLFEASGDIKQLGQGLLSQYDIDSNSAFADFNELLPDQVQSGKHPDGDRIRLTQLQDLFAEVRAYVQRNVEECLSQRVSHIVERDSGLFEVHSAGLVSPTKSVVLAPGGREREFELPEPYSYDQVLSGDLQRGQIEIDFSLQRNFLILGGAHSAFSSANYLREKAGDQDVEIRIVFDQDVKLFFESASDAHNAGYSFLEDDLCPETGRVNRFNGIRGDSKVLYLAAMSGEVKAVKLERLPGREHGYSRDKIYNSSPFFEHCQWADLIVSAIGYEAPNIPLLNESGEHLGPFRGPSGLVLADQNGRVFYSAGRRNGQVAQHFYALGLGHGELDGVNIFTAVGEQIAAQILSYTY